MRITGRVERLERERREEDPCPVCYGAGKIVVVQVDGDRDEPVEGCPGCGEKLIIRIIRE